MAAVLPWKSALAKLWMSYCNWIFPGPDLNFALIGQSIEMPLTEKRINGGLIPVHRLDKTEHDKPPEIPAET